MKGIPFTASVRLRLQNQGKITTKIGGNDIVVGQKVQAKLVKNRVGPPHTKADYDFYFASGIDNYGSWLNILKKYNLIKVGGAGWYTVVDETTGEEFKFQSSAFNDIMKNNPTLKVQLYNKICDRLIVVYEKNNFGIDDVSTIPENDPSLDIPGEAKTKGKKEKTDNRMLLLENDSDVLLTPNEVVNENSFVEIINQNINSSTDETDDDGNTVISFDELPDKVRNAILEEM